MPVWVWVEKALSKALAEGLETSVYSAAALAEIVGCFALWAWLRLGWSMWCLLPGLASLVLFAWLLTLIESPFAGRAYGSVSTRASKHRCAELKPKHGQAAPRMPSTATVLRRRSSLRLSAGTCR